MTSRQPVRRLAVLLVACALVLAVGGGPAQAAGGSWIVTVDQQSRSVRVLDHDLDVRWSWSADHDPGLADLRPAGTWSNPSEAKSRRLHGRHYLLTGASGGLAAVVSYPAAKVYWAVDTGHANVHSLELLPDGNVAVAASTEGWLRLYAASQGARSTRFTEVPLPGAHGVHHDPATGLLWALGSLHLLALKVTGTPAEPALTLVRTVPLPEPGGHDLAPVLTMPGHLWTTTRHHAWQYSPTTGRFIRARLSRTGTDPSLKAVGDDPRTGRLLTTAPEPGHACSWCTATLTFHRPHGTRALPGTQLYKARWWTSRRR